MCSITCLKKAINSESRLLLYASKYYGADATQLCNSNSATDVLSHCLVPSFFLFGICVSLLARPAVARTWCARARSAR